MCLTHVALLGILAIEPRSLRALCSASKQKAREKILLPAFVYCEFRRSVVWLTGKRQ